MSAPARRDLSGIFFRYRNPETARFENRTFEDLPESEQPAQRLLFVERGDDDEDAHPDLARLISRE